jgi:hypothetical protein
MSIICDRCGWFIPSDCTCDWRADQLSRARLRSKIEQRHRESVARAQAWADGNEPGGRKRAAAG